RSDVVALPGLQVESRHVSELPPGVHGVGVVGGDLYPHPVPAVHGVPVAIGDAQRITRPTRPTPHAVVLEATAHLIRRERAVDDHRVELSDGNRHVVPRLPAVPWDVHSAVVPYDEMLWVAAIDPQRMVVAVHEMQGVGREA